MKVYLGTYTKKESQGIYTVDIHDQNIDSVQLFTSIDSPTYLCHVDASMFSVVKEGDQGGIAYLKSGKLVNQVVEVGAPPCYVSYDEHNQLIYSSNYHGGRINTYALSDDTMHDVQKIHFGEGSKAHYIKYHPQLNRVVVCDLGKDQVHFFEVKPDKQLDLKHTYQTPTGSGPRHAVNHPTQGIVYVFSELSSEIYVLRYEADEVNLIQRVSALPEGDHDKKWGAAIRMSRDGRFVYVSNRGHDSMGVFEVNDDYSLSMIQNISCYGVQPRDFNLSLDDSLCLVANHDTNNLTLFARDEKSGRLSLLQKDVWAPEAVCVEFIK